MSYKEMLSQEKIKEKASLETVKSYWGGIGIAAIFSLALWLRYLPAQGMQYLQALDPYFIFRHARHLALSGNMPMTDFMRYFPYDAPTYVLNQGDIIFPAIMYNLGPSQIFSSFMNWAQFYPALMGGIGIIFTYFLGKELYNKVAGLSSAFFLATVAGVMHRTSAGFFEKEPIGTMFMMASLYFFTRSWKRNESISGILAGLSLGAFTISWGGSQMLWMLYPMVVGITMLLNEDIRRLVTVYTPTVLIGVGFGAVFNYSRFWITSDLAVINFGMLGFLWSRYLLEEFEMLDDRQLSYYVPSMSAIGLIALVLSPLYSSFIADKFFGLLSKASGAGGTSVILKTVSENQATSFGSLISSLGTSYGQALLSQINFGVIGAVGNLTGALPMAIIGTAFLSTAVGLMLLRKYGYISENVTGKEYFAILGGVYSAWILFFISFFEGFLIPGLALVLIVLGSLFALLLYTDEDSLFSISMMILGFTAVTQLMMVTGGLNSAMAALPPTLAVLGGIGLVYYTENMRSHSISMEWYHLLPLLWMLTNFLSALAKSRLMTLAAFPVAFVAGVAASKAFYWVKEADLSELVDSPQALRIAAVAIIGLSILIPNIATGLAATSQIGGSPNSLWMQNLDYMQENTENGSTILSWWDYGYHFQTIGERSTVADGGNLGYYSSTGEPVNYKLADFLASDNPENYTGFLEKHSVDYVVLDHSMIGKYQAVSQIHNRNNSNFNTMLTLSTANDITQSTYSRNNETLVQFSSQGLSIYVPTNLSQRSMGIEGPPTIRTGGGSRKLGCMLSDENGFTEFDVEDPVELSGFGEVCVAESPFFTMERAFITAQRPNIRAQSAQMVLIPRKIADSTLVRLYLTNGHDMDMFEPVSGGSNGYIRMWKVNQG